MDAIKYLLGEHSKFRREFKAISKMTVATKKQTRFKRLCNDLVRHETMEQKKWYPVLRKNTKLREIISHLLSEEKKAAKAIKSFKNKKYGVVWQLKFYKFKYDVEHHADEEESNLFPNVRKYLSKTELNTLGTTMRKFKAGLK